MSSGGQGSAGGHHDPARGLGAGVAAAAAVAADADEEWEEVEEDEESQESLVSWNTHARQHLGLGEAEIKQITEFVGGHLRKAGPLQPADVEPAAWTALVEHTSMMLTDLGLVMNLHCAACDSLFCRRGQMVTLVVDVETQLFSTDLVTKYARQDKARTTAGLQCSCHAVDVLCTQCAAVVGYHVLTPCKSCDEGGHNEHYWMFAAPKVYGKARLEVLSTATGSGGGNTNAARPRSPGPTAQMLVPPTALDDDAEDDGGVGDAIEAACASLLTWATIAPFREDQRGMLARLHPQFTGDAGGSAGVGDDAAAPDLSDFMCLICMELALDAAMLPCGHSFCETCAFRQADQHRCCAVCKAPADGAAPVPNYMVRQFLERTLTFRCRHGCEWDAAADAWTPRPLGAGGAESSGGDGARGATRGADAGASPSAEGGTPPSAGESGAPGAGSCPKYFTLAQLPAHEAACAWRPRASETDGGPE